MFKLQYCKSAVVVASLFAAAGTFAAGTISKADYDAGKGRVSSEYKAEKAACASFSGNQKDVCQERAKGKEKVARAELDYNLTGSVKDAKALAVAKADADYAVAKEMCDDKAGNAKDVCVAEAKATHTKALADVKLVEKVGAARKDAVDDKLDANYKVAAEKCEALAGDAKAACISDAKLRFNKG